MPPRPDKANLGRPDFDHYTADATQSTSSIYKAFDPKWLVQKLMGTAFQLARGMMLSTPYFDDHEWVAVRPLGQGGFGAVGLWHRLDDKGNVQDELVIKQMNRDPTHPDSYECPNHKGLLREAVMQSELNDKEPGDQYYNSYIRGFKYFNGDSTYRLYYTFAAGGDLNRLCGVYRMRDQYLPELFIWHVFYSLAKAIEVLSQPPPDQSLAVISRPHEDTTTWFLFHGDMKPGNVLLDYPPDNPPKDDPTGQYPQIRLTDFGLAEYTGADDHQNPTALDESGTPGYLAFEQIRPDKKWNHPLVPKDAKYTPSINVWLVGRTVFDILTLATVEEYESLLPPKEPDKNADDREYLISLAKIDARASHYSVELRRLVWNSLCAVPSKRPTTTELVLQTEAGLNTAKAHAIAARPSDQKDQPALAELVYYDNSSINAMPVGDRVFVGRDWPTEFDTFRSVVEYDDPAMEALQVPPGPEWDELRTVYQPPNRPEVQIGVDGLVYVAPLVPPPPPPPPPPPAQLPTKSEYWAMKIRQMQEELIYRGLYSVGELKRLRKNQLWWRLHQADQNGNFGRGVYRG